VPDPAVDQGSLVLIPGAILTDDRPTVDQVLQGRLETARVGLAIPGTGLRGLGRVDIDQLQPDPGHVHGVTINDVNASDHVSALAGRAKVIKIAASRVFMLVKVGSLRGRTELAANQAIRDGFILDSIMNRQDATCYALVHGDPFARIF
jgi:hypothetical protein